MEYQESDGQPMTNTLAQFPELEHLRISLRVAEDEAQAVRNIRAGLAIDLARYQHFTAELGRQVERLHGALANIAESFGIETPGLITEEELVQAVRLERQRDHAARMAILRTLEVIADPKNWTGETVWSNSNGTVSAREIVAQLIKSISGRAKEASNAPKV